MATDEELGQGGEDVARRTDRVEDAGVLMALIGAGQRGRVHPRVDRGGHCRTLPFFRQWRASFRNSIPMRRRIDRCRYGRSEFVRGFPEPVHDSGIPAGYADAREVARLRYFTDSSLVVFDAETMLADLLRIDPPSADDVMEVVRSRY